MARVRNFPFEVIGGSSRATSSTIRMSSAKVSDLRGRDKKARAGEYEILHFPAGRSIPLANSQGTRGYRLRSRCISGKCSRSIPRVFWASRRGIGWGFSRNALSSAVDANSPTSLDPLAVVLLAVAQSFPSSLARLIPTAPHPCHRREGKLKSRIRRMNRVMLRDSRMKIVQSAAGPGRGAAGMLSRFLGPPRSPMDRALFGRQKRTRSKLFRRWRMKPGRADSSTVE
jgi:hypothetical protein